ncbi:MAG: DUF1223 domain-containing protein [Candidatus Competibacteraceae bacterium]|nr:DUF1223 domain-containing protein [Candidatus Competibacteraceae bacterium]
MAHAVGAASALEEQRMRNSNIRRRRHGPRAASALILVLAALLPALAPAATCQAQSGPMQAALIELYTSEGCNSCPPADRWLAQLAAEPALAGHAVPLALHVDYWDGLGWRDRFAHASFSARQRALTAAQGSKTVFTPQVMINGHTAWDWDSKSAFDRQMAEIGARPAPVTLVLNVTADPGVWQIQLRGQLQARLSAARAGAFLALYQNGLSSQITAGENAARQLRHERVVLQLVGPLPVGADGRFTHAYRFKLPANAEARDFGVAAFVQDQTDGQVWQALALAACSG